MTGTTMKASVVLTRPQGKNEQLAGRLRAAGWQALILPALRICPLLRDGDQLPSPADYDLIVFVSSNAVRFYLDLLDRRPGGHCWPERTLAATVGRSSAQPLYDSGLMPHAHILHPDPGSQSQDSEALWALLQPRLHRLGRVLIVRGVSGREWLGAQCEEAGARVERLALYGREPALWRADQAADLRKALARPESCVFLLTSGESVDAVHANVRRLGLEAAWARCRFVVIHERVAGRLQSVLGASGNVAAPMVKVCSPSDDAIFQAIGQMASPQESS
ncbi:uroporphyrinogen-III synthase [Pollutimonas bauzanensis]|uniref:Uroporphyrinogen-III synthase n=1 Tax=Pollutimonas bauzanensis TaxID=658167 RepID=A0A1M5MG80_9BURK|nr:uroporphyrinogen-III synthase [Pollutimonas bauzanensis]SHG75879.1 uroporphyrinogen-III synthase [Pollutimonas bauzanensis]